MLSRQYNRADSAENSLMSTDRHNVDTRSYLKQPKVQIPRSMISNGPHIKHASINAKNQLLNAIKYTQSINKIEVNPKFIELLTNEFEMSRVVIISIWGPAHSGKSFLTDSLLTTSEGTIIRVFSKSENEGANCSMRRVLSRDGNPLLFLDWRGFTGQVEEMQSDVFLLMYLISSVIIFNYNCSKLQDENAMLEICSRMKSKLVSDEAEYSLPQLLIIRRDVNASNNRTTNFLQAIHTTQLFQPNPSLAYMQYPGTQAIKQNELLDAPIVTLDKNFNRTCSQLLEVLKSAKPKYINDNPINSSMLSILLSSFTSMINRHHRVVLDNCWDNVLQALAVNAYNSYVTAYTQSLEKQFGDEQPLNKYDLFKKLFKAKTQANIKLQNFTNIRGEPIFDKYKEKLKEFIKGKEQMVASINTSKSNNLNSQYVAQAQREYFSPAQVLKQERIYSYLRSLKNLPLEESKTEIINSNLQDLINNQLKKVGNKSQAPQLKAQLKRLQERHTEILSQIDRRGQNANQIENQLKQLRGTISRYQIKIEEKEADLRQLTDENRRRDQERKNKMTEQQRQDEGKMDEMRRENDAIIESQELAIEDLKKQLKLLSQKMSAEQAQNMSRIRERDEAMKGMLKRTKELEKTMTERRGQIERLKGILAKPESKKATCGCFG